MDNLFNELISQKEWGRQVLVGNQRTVERTLRTALKWSVGLAFLVPFSILLALLDIPEDWHGVRVFVWLVAFLVGWITGFVWLWWRGERINERTERKYIESEDFEGLASYQLYQRMRGH